MNAEYNNNDINIPPLSLIELTASDGYSLGSTPRAVLQVDSNSEENDKDDYREEITSSSSSISTSTSASASSSSSPSSSTTSLPAKSTDGSLTPKGPSINVLGNDEFPVLVIRSVSGNISLI